MAASVDDQDIKIQKLEMIIKKGDMIISMLEKQGVPTDDVKVKINSAKQNLSKGEMGSAYKLAQECITDLMKLKETADKPKDEEKSKRGKGVFALIRDNRAEMNRKLEEWKRIIKGWRDKGYNFENDQSLFSHQFEEIEKRFISIGGQIEKAEIIRGKLNRMKEDFPSVGQSYLSKIEDVEKAIFRLDRLDSIERRVDNLAQSLRAVDERFKQFRIRISRYRRNGLDTASLDEIIENEEDAEYLEKQFNIYEGNIDFLLKEKTKLKSFKEMPLPESVLKKVSELEKIINNPWLLDQVVERMLALEKDLHREKENLKRREEERSRRDEILSSLEKYRSEGFRTDVVEQLLDEDINLLEEEFDIFIRQTTRLKSLKEKLFKLDATGFEEDISRISQKLFDPSNLDNIENELSTLKEKILEKKVKSQKIEGAIKEWAGLGFKISKLENLLKTDIDTADELYEDYRKWIDELKEYETQLQDIKQKDMDELVHRITLKIKNPELIESVRKEMSVIQKKVSEIEGLRGKRKELNNLLKVWKIQGYNIDRILDLMREEDTVSGMDNIILNYSRSIASVEALKGDLASEERGWFPKDEEFIKKNLQDPEMSSEVLSSFENLKTKNTKEEKRRGEISRKLRELSSRDIDVSRIEPLLLGDTETLNNEYEVFKEKVKKLLKIKATLLKESHKTKDQSKEMLAKSFSDPYSVEQYEDQLSGKAPISQQQAKAAKPAKDGEEIDKQKELAKTHYKEGRFEEALEMFQNILSRDPNNKECNFYLKKVLLKIKPSSGKPKPVKAQPPPEEKNAIDEEEKPAPSQSGADPNCLSCHGTGNCIWCSGKGKCSTCHGTGESLGSTCSTCGGSGDCSVCKGSGKCSWCMV
ncbi:MAG: hypothetical protein ACMUIE_00945 [Thermoplasmatota archaeon]